MRWTPFASGSEAAGPVAAGDPPSPPVAKASSGRVPPTAPPAAQEGRVKASPLARRIAKDAGVDLATLTGSGPGGRIVKADVERAEGGAPAAGDAQIPDEQKAAEAQAPTRAAEPTPGAREKPETARGSAEEFELSRLQQTVARRMAESKATAPHFYLNADVDMSRAVEARGRIKAASGEGEVVPSFNDMVVRACSALLIEHRPGQN